MESTKKMFYTVGELVEMFDVSPALIRYWESQFDVIKPRRNKKGNRLFTPADLENFKIIYNLIRERGLTLKGAKQAMQKGAMVDGSALSRDAQIMERLNNLRAMLVEMRTMMKEGQEPIEKRVNEQINEGVIEVIVEDIEDKNTQEEQVAQADLQPQPQRPRRSSEGEATEKELFAFYEQRLPLSASDEE